MRNLLRQGLVIGVMGLPAAPVLGQNSQSAALATELTGLLGERHLDAFAAEDAEEPTRFAAALFFPDSQLLVVSAHGASLPRVRALLEQREYRQIYLELQDGSIADSRVFFQDLNADGLHASRNGAIDIMYERDVTQIFDGDWNKHKLTEKAYKEKFAEADTRYSRMLAQLIDALKMTK